MRRIATIAVIGALGAPSAAFAADSGYGAAEGVSSGGPQEQAHAGKKLPFTGLDVVPMLAAGAVLLGAGFGLARVGRDHDEREQS